MISREQHKKELRDFNIAYKASHDMINRLEQENTKLKKEKENLAKLCEDREKAHNEKVQEILKEFYVKLSVLKERIPKEQVEKILNRGYPNLSKQSDKEVFIRWKKRVEKQIEEYR